MSEPDRQTRDPSDTPMMRQYMAIKDSYPEAILMYRMGDFYEMFYEDALIAAKALDLTLTSRNKNSPDPVPMCGIPHHASVGYVSKLIEQGFKVAVCEQMEDPAKVKGLVKREVVRVITPGVIIDEENLDARANNFLAAVLPLHGQDSSAPQDVFALCAMDASTGEFKGTRLSGTASLVGELFRLEPREILASRASLPSLQNLTAVLPRCCMTAVDDDLFAGDGAVSALVPLLGEAPARELFREDALLCRAAGAVASYLRATRPLDDLPVTRFSTYRMTDHLILDEATKRHLELVRTADGDKKGSLLHLLDQTGTPMGGRRLRGDINYPLCDAAAIARRLARVELFFADAEFLRDTRELLGDIGDLERVATRVGMNAATPRDLGALRATLARIPRLDDLLTSCRNSAAE